MFLHPKSSAVPEVYRVPEVAPDFFELEGKESNFVLLMDSMDPVITPWVPSLLVTSPRLRLIKEARKASFSRVFYFPVFSQQEIYEMWRVCFPSLPQEGVAERYARWGGIPRYVFDKILPPDQALLELGIGSATAEQLQMLVSSAQVDDGVLSHRIVHCCIKGEQPHSVVTPSDPDYYDAVSPAFASGYVQDRVYDRLKDGFRAQLRNFLRASSNFSVFGSLSGGLFQSLAQERLAAGGTFEVHSLSDDKSAPSPGLVDAGSAGSTGAPSTPTPVALPTHTWLDLASRNDLPSHFSLKSPSLTQRRFGPPPMDDLSTSFRASEASICLLQPTSKSFCAIDFVLPHGICANVSIDAKHDIVLEAKPKSATKDKGEQADAKHDQREDKAQRAPVQAGLMYVLTALSIEKNRQFVLFYSPSSPALSVRPTQLSHTTVHQFIPSHVSSFSYLQHPLRLGRAQGARRAVQGDEACRQDPRYRCRQEERSACAERVLARHRRLTIGGGYLHSFFFFPHRGKQHDPFPNLVAQNSRPSNPNTGGVTQNSRPSNPNIGIGLFGMVKA